MQRTTYGIPTTHHHSGTWARLLPAAMIAAALGTCTFEHSKIAEPKAYDRCVQSTSDGLGNTIVGNTVGNTVGQGSTFGNTIAGNTVGNTSGPVISGQTNSRTWCCIVIGDSGTMGRGSARGDVAPSVGCERIIASIAGLNATYQSAISG
jgi:hypothetical protein